MNEIEKRRIRLIFGLIGGLFGAQADYAQGRENRQWQSAENEKDRQFNAAEAQKSRDWQERMYHQNESPQAQVQQQLQAGLNPFANGASSQSVGSGSTASASSSALPPAPPIGNYLAGLPQAMLGIKQTKSEIANTEADTQVKLSQARTEWFNSIIAETNALNRQSIIDAEIAGLQETTGLTRAQRKENEIRVKMLEEFKNNGGNTFTDASLYTKSLTALNNLSYELDDKYKRVSMKAGAKMSVEELKQLRTQTSEFLRTSNFRVELSKLGVDEAEANLQAQLLENILTNIDVNTLRELVGDGGTPRDVIVAIFRKYFGDLDN